MRAVTQILIANQFFQIIQGVGSQFMQNGLQQLEYVLECLLWSDGHHNRIRKLSFHSDSLEAKALQTSLFLANQSGRGRPSGRTIFHTNVHGQVAHATDAAVFTCF